MKGSSIYKVFGTRELSFSKCKGGFVQVQSGGADIDPYYPPLPPLKSHENLRHM